MVAIPRRYGGSENKLALTAILSFHFALSANVWFKPAVDTWAGWIDLKGVMKGQLPIYGSNRCHITVQVS